MHDRLNVWKERVAVACGPLVPLSKGTARSRREQRNSAVAILRTVSDDLSAVPIPNGDAALTKTKARVVGLITEKTKRLSQASQAQITRIVAGELIAALNGDVLSFITTVAEHEDREKAIVTAPLSLFLGLHSRFQALAPVLDVAVLAVKASPLCQVLGARITATPRAAANLRYEGADWIGLRTTLPAEALPTLIAQARDGTLAVSNDRFAFPSHRAWNLSQFSSTSNSLEPAAWPRATATGSGHPLREAFASNLYYAWRDQVGTHPHLVDVKDLVKKLELRSDFGSGDNHRQTMFEIELPVAVTRTSLSPVEACIEVRLDTVEDQTLEVLLKLRNDSTEQTDVRTIVLSRETTSVRWATRTPDGNLRVSAKLQAGDTPILETAFHQHWSEPTTAPSRKESTGAALQPFVDRAVGARTVRADLPRPSPGAELSGVTVVGRWELENAIGSGGYGTVYSARHLITHHACAVKIIPYQDDDLDALSERLKRETRASNEVLHPSIVPVVDAGIDTALKVAYASMERLRGAPLAKSIGRPMTTRAAAKLVRPVLDALALCHERGIYHRDLSPGNLFLTNDGIVRILDFGLCYLVGRPRVTVSVAALGNPEYASPEQLMRSTIEPDATTDVWSLGVMLYELLTGAHPFRRETPFATAAAAASAPHKPASELGVDEGLSRVIDQCLAKDRAHRFQDASELLAVLQPLLP